MMTGKSTVRVLLLWMLAVPFPLFAADQEAPESDARKKERDENLKAMEKRALETKVRLVGREEKINAALVPKPLFHYTDEPRRIIDATLWGWTVEGRLVAVGKIEKYDHPQPHRIWLNCFGSLCPGLIEAEWPDGHRWTAQKPGIELEAIAKVPSPAEGKVARMRQMKEISNRFTAVITDTEQKVDQDMRLLPRPLYRYEKAAGDLVDGAVFGFTTNGTNPDAILSIELHKREGATPEWKFGLAGMTAGALSVRLDDREVWTKPYVGNTGSYETWLWFFEKPKQALE
jgi:hypothetical protein